MATDLSTLKWGSRAYAGSDSKDQSASYSFNFTSNGQKLTFIPTSVINKGVDAGKSNYVLPWFLSQENMGKLGKTGEYVDLAGQSWYGDYLKDKVGASTTGFLIPTGSLPFDSKVSTVTQPVKGIAQTGDGPAYILEPPAGKSAQYVTSNAKITTITPGRSILGKVFGGIGDDLAGAFNDTLGSINELGPWANAAISIAYPPAGAAIAAANAGQAAATGDIKGAVINGAKAVILSNAGDGLLGSPTTPSTAAPVTPATTTPVAATSSAGATGQLGTGISSGASGLGLKAAVGDGINLAAPAAGAGGLGLTSSSLGAGAIGAGLGTSAAASGTGSLLPTTPTSLVAPKASSGLGLKATTGEGLNLAAPAAGSGGLGLKAGLGSAGLASMGGGTGLTIAGAGGGVLSEAGLNTGVGALGGIGAGLGTSAAATGTGSLLKDAVDVGSKAITVSNVVDAIKAGVLVNAITGDPLGLSGDKGGGSAPASTGFAMVPIPAEWKSPTYAASSAPIDLESIFSDQNMLGGTQWQGLPTQRPNISFNDIFASGKQQTPMGSPVDMNQIMRSILGQTATSQKPA